MSQFLNVDGGMAKGTIIPGRKGTAFEPVIEIEAPETTWRIAVSPANGPTS